MTTEPTPDPVTDEEAYTALRAQSWALQSEIRRIESERERRRYAQEAERARLASEKHAATMAETYPNPVPDQVYALAADAAYNHDGEDADEADISEFYRQIVEVINAAAKKYRTTIRNIHNLHGNSVDPNECMECDMSSDAHQLAETTAVLA
jgi:hypothetical protein